MKQTLMIFFSKIALSKKKTYKILKGIVADFASQ